MARRTGFQFIVILLALLCLPWQAQAANSLRPYAPWMTFRDGMDESIRKPSPVARTPGTKAFTAGKPLPEKPVMTPRDTMDVINQLYSREPLRLSALEESYSRRIIDEITQFGYDQFGTPEKEKPGKKEERKSEPPVMPAGAVQDSFVLNNGDQLRVTFRGQRQDSKLYAVNSQGQLIVNDLPPVSAAGRTIADLRGEIQAQAARLHNTEVFISLEAVRQINVLVIGHVGHPGRQTLTVFSTVLDALMATGGIAKTGSLRQVRLVRDGRSTIIDLYGLLVHSSTIMDLGLRDGDHIIVPPVGPTVAVAGGVKRPGIYEIQPDLRGGTQSTAEKLSLDDLLDMAGGLLMPGKNRYIKLGLTGDGRETVSEVTNPLAHIFSDGSILKVEPAVEARTGTIELAGHTRRPGIYELGRAANLSALINSSKVFGRDIYPLIGVIERHDETQQAEQMIAFPPLRVVKGRFDRRLHDGDVVYLFSRRQIRDLQKDGKGKIADRRREIGNDDDERDAEQAAGMTEYGSAAHGPDEYTGPIATPDMKSFLRERSAFIRGAVRQEGAWPVADGASLENVIAVAGGLTLEAGTDDIEVTSRIAGFGAQDKGRGAVKRYNVNYAKTNPADVIIKPGDSVRVKQKFLRVADDSVLIVGEVASPGRYDLSPGDHLSDLIRRAGGITPHAYPQGAIFSRESERRAEEARFRAQAQELEAGLAATLAGGKHKDDGVDQSQIGAAQELIGELKNAEAVGRITVQADPGMLASKPEQDILLESGDRVYVPKRPLTVRVAGEVLYPAALAFRKDKDAKEYITEAGGFTYNADKERAFVVYPDGSAQPLQVSLWNHSATMIPPGSTVIVPRDPKPFDFIQTARDVSQILSNLAITGIFIDDIRRNP